jgi:hypothetical protein
VQYLKAPERFPHVVNLHRRHKFPSSNALRHPAKAVATLLFAGVLPDFFENVVGSKS